MIDKATLYSHPANLLAERFLEESHVSTMTQMMQLLLEYLIPLRGSDHLENLKLIMGRLLGEPPEEAAAFMVEDQEQLQRELAEPQADQWEVLDRNLTVLYWKMLQKGSREEIGMLLAENLSNSVEHLSV